MTTLKHQLYHRATWIEGHQTSAAMKHQLQQNANYNEISNITKHQTHQNIGSARLVWPEGIIRIIRVQGPNNK